MVMTYYTEGEVDEFKSKISYYKQELSNAQTDFRDLEIDFKYVQDKIPRLRKEVIHYNEHGHISDYSAVELMKIIEQMEF